MGATTTMKKKYIIYFIIAWLVLVNIPKFFIYIYHAEKTELIGKYKLDYCKPSDCSSVLIEIRKNNTIISECQNELKVVIRRDVNSWNLKNGVKINILTENRDFFTFPYINEIHRDLLGNIQIPYSINGECNIDEWNYLIKLFPRSTALAVECPLE